MKNKNSLQVWITLKMWVTGVVVNTLAGVCYLTGFNLTDELNTFLFVGLVLSLIFSFPVCIVLLIIICRCVRSRVHPRKIFKYVFCTGIFTTGLVFWLFSYALEIHQIVFPLLLFALLACAVAIGSQYKSIMRLVPRSETAIETFLQS